MVLVDLSQLAQVLIRPEADLERSGHHELHDSFKSGTQIGFKPEADYSARGYIHGAA